MNALLIYLGQRVKTSCILECAMLYCCHPDLRSLFNMRQVSADYERVKRAIGPEQADRILEAAYQQEQVEKERKWGARSKMRVGAR